MQYDILFETYPYLETERLILKKIEASDADGVFNLYSNDEVFRYCGIIPKHNYETVRKMIGHFERDYNKRQNIKLGIFSKEDSGKFTGIIEMMNFKNKVNMVTVGYFLAEEYWGRGFATEALKKLKDHLFEVAVINRIQAEIMPENTASEKVLLKSGFVCEGLIRQGAFWPGKGVVDLKLFAVLNNENQ